MEEGWRMLSRVDSADSAEAQGAALEALGEAHSGGCAHGDCRKVNALVRPRAKAGWDVRFVDFDWAGLEGEARYPPLMSEQIEWPAGAMPGELLARAHDAILLRQA